MKDNAGAHAMRDVAYTVVYDGTCAVCQRIVSVLRRWDRGMLEVVPFQAPAVQSRFPWIPARAYEESLQLVGPDGETWQGAAAIEQVLKLLPRGQLIAWILGLPLVRPVAERLYRWFARNRYRLGCTDHCSFKAVKLDYNNQSS
jgi:predicted DCC family thiol-disulfide oxidoreductase YuxK